MKSAINDDLNTVLANAYWWYSGGEQKKYRVDATYVCDGTDDICCVIYNESKEEEIGNLTLTLQEAISIGLEKID